MKISRNWLQEHIDDPLPDTNTLVSGITFHAFEIESIEEKESDTIFDIKVLPDRAHDCLSHRGIARELAAIFKLPLRAFPHNPLPAEKISLPIEVEGELCRRYAAAVIRGVTVRPSPAWLSKKLEAIGQRSINNIVDATNYVLFNSGQPVHAFDIAKIEKGIVVRPARNGERLVTLSGEECELSEEALVIADYLQPIALAGVKGGKTAEVTEETKDILIEVGNFDPVSVRKTARKFNLLTDAAKRFENDLTPAIVAAALSEIISIILDVAGGTVEGVFDYYPAPVQPAPVTVDLSDMKRLLGEGIQMNHLTEVYDRYGYPYTVTENQITITPPLERLDLTGAHDVAEDVGRLIGYETIEGKLFTPPFPPVVNDVFARAQEIRRQLIQRGYAEVMTYSFRKKGEMLIAYASKDKAALRTSLLEGLRESYELNKQHMALLNIADLKLFEIGTVFSENKEAVHVATIDSKGESELPLEDFDIGDVMLALEPLRTAGVHGQFKMWSLYPYIVRDIAVWIPEGDAAREERLSAILLRFGIAHTKAGPFLFDRFSKDGKTSLGYRFIFQSDVKTLTVSEVNEVFEKLTKELVEAGFEIR